MILLAIALGSALVDQRHQLGADTRPERKPLDPDARDLVRADPVHRPAAARADPLAAREGVRRGAIAQGASPIRVMFAEILPNIASSVLVFFTLIIASNILTEAASVVPRRRRAAAEPVVGDADRGGPGRASRPRRG